MAKSGAVKEVIRGAKLAKKVGNISFQAICYGLLDSQEFMEASEDRKWEILDDQKECERLATESIKTFAVENGMAHLIIKKENN